MRSITAFVTLLALCACASRAQAPAGFALSVQPAIAGEANTIEVRDPSLRARTIAVEVGMPEMEMPAKIVTLVQESPGTYVARGVTFAMSGSWSFWSPGPPPHNVVIAVR